MRLILPPDQAVLLLSLTLIPTASSIGLDPWLIVVTVLASAGSWLLPSQMPSYLVAYSAPESRLYSPLQARRVALAYTSALALSLPYWHLLGLVYRVT